MTRVLLVDGSAGNRQRLCELLLGGGLDVDEAQHRAEALATIGLRRPDLVLSALPLAGEDGPALLRHCKADPQLGPLPYVVCCAAEPDALDRQVARDLGADAVIAQPVEPAALLRTLHGLLERRMRRLEGQVAERDRAEAALRAALAHRAELQRAVDAHALLSMTDRQGRITFVNDRFCEVLGYARDELIGQNHRIINSRIHPPAFFSELWNTILQGRVWHGEILDRAKDGHLVWMETAVVPFADEQGKPHRFAAIRTDASARKRAEQSRRELEDQLRQMQKLQAVGTLAGGIAHDFNNIIGTILGYVALARQEAPNAPVWHDHLAQIQAAGERARGVVQRILAFSRPQPVALGVVSLQSLVLDTLRLLRGTLPAMVRLETRLADVPLHARVDATQIEQVLLNLITTAWHALEGSTGRIEIGLEATEIGADPAASPLVPAPGSYVHLWVADDGCGMDGPTQARIFEPFFTTKPAGQGTGLGLSVVRSIVSAHDGGISVDSRPGQGCTFHVYLRRAQAGDERAPAQAAAAPPTAVGPLRHVLLVDDDRIITTLSGHALEQAGYRVSSFNDARQALAALRAQPCAFDVVVTDHNMAGLSGLDLAREVKAIRPDLPLVLASGYIDDALDGQATGLGVAGLLRKERLAEDLLPLVAVALSAAPAGA